MPVLIKYHDNYADEFDLQGFAIRDAESWNQHVERMKNAAWPQARWFGTNEGVEFDEFDHYINRFTVKEITEEQANFLIKNFGFCYGHFLELDKPCKEPSYIW